MRFQARQVPKMEFVKGYVMQIAHSAGAGNNDMTLLSFIGIS